MKLKSLFNITDINYSSYPRHFALITIKGRKRLACKINDEWIIDSTCKTINEMLEQGVVSEEAVVGWSELQSDKDTKH
ncbi:hypothetical protein OPS25_01340 [Alteromonas ponticola]|uniref:Uncharacterized protein n=1 Tax=Alteromonas aquimaris TaxID=2998417 RepID=A0ABT3P4V9_9ALTE|nr:hypothetical protein [Alteromonas aquimaris]MCW8107146.1 hypothetical protein [Alteromonas aquimaris]